VLDIEIIDAKDTDTATRIFHRDGFVAVKNALSAQQFETIRTGAARVIAEQTAAIKLENANRGFARYSFGDQMRNPEWAVLVDLPPVLNIVERIWNSQDFICTGGGGDYSLPGAEIQALHADMGEFLHDPTGAVSSKDLPTPFIVVNFLMVDFTRENGAIRFVPCTHRSRTPIPSLNEEPEWMKNSILCAPAGAAIIRDVRCWHGGTANTSKQIRPMTSVGYTAPWFNLRQMGKMPRAIYSTLSERGKKICAGQVVEE
jgi:ectoine hydroxylase-related dioxygenase (phytanoyl-CoA dioxygenase family)